MGRMPIYAFYYGCCGHIFEVSFFTLPSHTLVLMACQVSKFISFTFFSVSILSQSLILFILAPLVFFLFIIYNFLLLCCIISCDCQNLSYFQQDQVARQRQMYDFLCTSSLNLKVHTVLE